MKIKFYTLYTLLYILNHKLSDFFDLQPNAVNKQKSIYFGHCFRVS